MARWMAIVVFFSGLSQVLSADFAHRRILSENFKYDGSGKVKVAFFDADSTLRVSKVKGAITAQNESDVFLLPFVGQALKRTAEAGYLIAIVSNQGGIPEKISLERAEQALLLTIDLIEQKGGKVHYLDFAEGPDTSEPKPGADLTKIDRKPGIGIAVRLEEELRRKFNDPKLVIDKTQSYVVGDSAYLKAKPGKAAVEAQPGIPAKPAVPAKPGEFWPNRAPGTNFSNADRLFANNFGIDYSYVRDFFGYAPYGIDYFDNIEQASAFFKMCEEKKINCD